MTQQPQGDAFTSFRIPATDRQERVQQGKRLREVCPHEELARWRPADDRPDPVALIEQQHEGRLPWLIGVRVGRMAANPYGFLRGAAVVQAFDSARLPATGLQTVCCGDSHVGNFGFYRSPEGEQVIDLNDFDEAHTGSWEWDLRRLTASIWVAGRTNGNPEDACAEAVHACVSAYRDEVSFLSKQPLLWRAFNHVNINRLHEEATEESLRDEIARAAKAARKRTSDRVAPKFTQKAGEQLKIVEDPPLLTRVTGIDRVDIAQGLDDYLPSLSPQWRRIVGGYTLVDIAHKVVGVGSVGLRAYVALLVGSRPDDILFLQLKQARRSVLARYVHGDEAWHAHQGQRVVEYQQQLQTVSDPLLGWTSVGEHQYYVRQFRNMKGTVPLDAITPAALSAYAGIVGHLLAKGHARTSGASLISGYLGKSDAAADALSVYAKAYADQTEADHALLVKAARSGRLPVDEAAMGSSFRP